jgi:uncharacterized protein (DUF302 family)
MKKSLVVLYAMTSFVGADNLIIKESKSDFNTTVKQIQKSIQARDMKILGLIDHKEIAHQGTMNINDEQVILFANPNYNSRMILNDPNVALELPMKIAVRKDFKGKVLLITSANHMRRAQLCFENANLNTTAFPTDCISSYRTKGIQYNIFPRVEALSQWENLIHEWIGFLVYKATF